MPPVILAYMLIENTVALPEGASLMDALGGTPLPWFDIKVRIFCYCTYFKFVTNLLLAEIATEH